MKNTHKHLLISSLTLQELKLGASSEDPQLLAQVFSPSYTITINDNFNTAHHWGRQRVPYRINLEIK